MGARDTDVARVRRGQLPRRRNDLDPLRVADHAAGVVDEDQLIAGDRVQRPQRRQGVPSRRRVAGERHHDADLRPAHRRPRA